ncbi:alpha-1,4-glucan--maltose-1-phosphate maltosyltransferase, partial [Sphingomonas sp.]|uniref:alpha-1,4-glucan--maltose-1-phosphate maltosyltransferase n=1 Tax=Sphingomonas sp. TaxID=28214 RepID=UPI003AFFA319
VATGGVDPARLAPLIAAARSALPKAELLAGPVGGGSVRALRQAGVDRLVTAFGWWDLSAPWLLDELEAARGLLPVAAEFRREQLHGSDEPARIARLLSVAAALSDTLIVPASVFADASLVQRVRTIGQAALGYRGAVRRLSDPQAGVTVLLRGDTGDLRAATAATLLLVNRADEPVDAPDAASLLAVAGVGLRAIARAGGRGDPFVPLGPGEVRLLTARVARPIASAVKPGGKAARAFAEECPRIVVEQVAPSVSGGAFAVKRVVGETVEVEALVYADGHEQLAAELLWRAYDDKGWTAVPLTFEGNDLWTASFTPTRMGRHEFVVEAWLDRFGGFRRDFAKKLEAGVAQPVDYMEGRALVAEAAARAGALADWPARLEAAGDGEEGTALLLSPELASAMAVADDRRHRTRSSVQLLDAERLEARFSSWYELFPRSMSGTKDRHGTFRDVINHLPRVRDMGFDTLYFPPIHPIGTANRKGPNNTLTPAEGDPGSPYAIGSADGGHDAIHPELGTFEDFRALIAAARAEGLEIAIDFAIQCSPDHPWLKEHPGWFAWRPDGSMKYAENPPKKYQDIVNVDFYAPDAVPALWCALRDIVLLWAREGIRTFRVDNPHTKPLPFWQWMIGEVRRQYPDAIFLAEAFTRPAMMYRLAKIGFSQSYTYFTWRDDKAELIEYIEELTTTAPREFYRPHFFVNTPDINPVYLQTSGRPGFRVRAVLAATLSGLFGVYSGFELCEAAPLPGKEEYLDSEKYELRPRDWNAPGNIVADITLLNRLRRANPALQTHLNTRFYSATNDAIIYYGKPEPSGTGMILVMVNLDPHNARECEFDVPLWEFGLPDEGSVSVEDMARGYRFDWHGKRQFIRLDPDEPYRIWRIAPKENPA